MADTLRVKHCCRDMLELDTSRICNVRSLLYLLFLVLFMEVTVAQCDKGLVEVQARQEIEYLRRRYAKATDFIGKGTDDSVAKGRAIYHRIFTSDAELRSSAGGEPRIGPDAWVELVKEFLVPLGPTQHLIGTQVVDIEAFELGDNCRILSGSAHMESYVQAWHERLDNKVWVYLGIYHDHVSYVPGIGWRIDRMSMEQIGGETRFMDSAVSGSM